MASEPNLALTKCSIEFQLAPGELESAVQLLLSVVGHTEAKPGCRSCSVARDAGREGRVRYEETWSSEASFHQHVRSEEFRRVLVAMDMCCEEPQVVIGNLSGRSGLDCLRELREAEEGQPGLHLHEQ